jgi:hypothetical protein
MAPEVQGGLKMRTDRRQSPRGPERQQAPPAQRTRFNTAARTAGRWTRTLGDVAAPPLFSFSRCACSLRISASRLARSSACRRLRASALAASSDSSSLHAATLCVSRRPAHARASAMGWGDCSLEVEGSALASAARRRAAVRAVLLRLLAVGLELPRRSARWPTAQGRCAVAAHLTIVLEERLAAGRGVADCKTARGRVRADRRPAARDRHSPSLAMSSSSLL